MIGASASDIILFQAARFPATFSPHPDLQSRRCREEPRLMLIRSIAGKDTQRMAARVPLGNERVEIGFKSGLHAGNIDTEVGIYLDGTQQPVSDGVH